MKSRLLLIVGLALTACHSKKTDDAARPAETPVKVTTIVAAEQSVAEEIPLTGVLEANERTELAANAAGRVTKVLVELGQTVAAGAVIAQLDTSTAALSQAEAAANVKSAEEQLATARLDCDRYEGLLKKGAITQQEYDKAQGDCRHGSAEEAAAKAKAAKAAKAVSDGTIRAPFSGKIAAKTIHVGDYVREDTKVVTLLSDNPLRLQLTVPEPSIFAVKAGTNVRFESLGVKGRSFQATIANVGREVRAQSRDVVVEGTVDNADGALLPGMFTTAHLQTGETRRPVVPRSAVVVKDDESSVFVVVEKRLQQRAVHLGAAIGEGVAVMDGVKAGENVVTDPGPATVDGALAQ